MAFDGMFLSINNNNNNDKNKIYKTWKKCISRARTREMEQEENNNKKNYTNFQTMKCAQCDCE